MGQGVPAAQSWPLPLPATGADPEAVFLPQRQHSVRLSFQIAKTLSWFPRADLPYFLAPWPPFLGGRGQREKRWGVGEVRSGNRWPLLYLLPPSFPHRLPTWGLTDTGGHQQDSKQDPHGDGDHHQGSHPRWGTWRNQDFNGGFPPAAPPPQPPCLRTLKSFNG